MVELAEIAHVAGGLLRQSLPVPTLVTLYPAWFVAPMVAMQVSSPSDVAEWAIKYDVDLTVVKGDRNLWVDVNFQIIDVSVRVRASARYADTFETLSRHGIQMNEDADEFPVPADVFRRQS